MRSLSTDANSQVRPSIRAHPCRARQLPGRSGIGFHTPADVHYGRADAVRDQRAVVLDAAYAEHPERFVRKAPEPPKLPTVAWINEPKEDSPSAQ